MGSVRGDQAQERERVHPCRCNVCDEGFKSLQMPSQHKIWQPSGNVFVCKGCGKNFNPNNSINRLNKLMRGKPHHRKSFCHFSMWGKVTIEEIIINLNVWGGGVEEEDSSGQLQEEGDIFYPLKWNSIGLFFNTNFV